MICLCTIRYMAWYVANKSFGCYYWRIFNKQANFCRQVKRGLAFFSTFHVNNINNSGVMLNMSKTRYFLKNWRRMKMVSRFLSKY